MSSELTPWDAEPPDRARDPRKEHAPAHLRHFGHVLSDANHNAAVAGLNPSGGAGSGPLTDGDLASFSAASLPRIVILDQTRMGDGTATGELKSSLLRDWPADRILQVFGGHQSTVGVLASGAVSSINLGEAHSRAMLGASVREFRPDAILYRPTPDTPYLHELAMELVSTCDTPVLTWIMDDWPTALRRRDEEQFRRLEADLRSLFAQSAGAMSIGSAMTEVFEQRYGRTFHSFANGIDRDDWKWSAVRVASGDVKIRYSGSLATDMGLDTLLAIARAVDDLAAEGHQVTLEINTHKYWAETAGGRFQHFKCTQVTAQERSPADYRAWMASADIVLICYNFDEVSKGYVRYSVANKLPECLASGAALLSVGPSDIATLSLLRSLDCGMRVETQDAEIIAQALRRLVTSPETRMALAQRARNVALEHFDLRAIRSRFARWLTNAILEGNSRFQIRALRRSEGRLWLLQRRLRQRQEREQFTDISPVGRPAPDDPLQQLSRRLGGIASTLRSRFPQKAI